MEHQRKESISDNEPFEIVHNARKTSKHLKSTAAKSRKNSTISLAEEKQKKIKKKPRKLTDYVSDQNASPEQLWHGSPKQQQIENNIFMETILGFEEEKIVGEWKQKQPMEQVGLKQQEEFYFQDCEGEKGIMEGIGDQNSLAGQFKFDFFNPQKYSKQ